MLTIRDSYTMEVRIETALDKNNLMGYTRVEKIAKLKKAKRLITKLLSEAMYPQDETIKLKELRKSIDTHVLFFNNR